MRRACRVHLGSMGESIRTVMQANAGTRMKPGDAYVVNDPITAAPICPSVTIITAGIRPRPAARSCSTVGSRCGHHADIGGTTPGSMPPIRVPWKTKAFLPQFSTGAGRRIP